MLAMHARRQLTCIRSFGQDRRLLVCGFNNQTATTSQWFSSAASALAQSTTSTGQNRRLLCRFTNQPATTSQWFSSAAASAPAQSTSTSTSVCSEEEKETQLLMQELNEANAKYEGKVAIQTTADQRGWGVCALTTFQQGDFLMRGTAVHHAPVQTKHSLQVDWNRHVEIDLPARFINHVCNDANVGVRPNDFGAYDFYALRRIDKDEELLWDYETTEYQVLEGFSCSCGSPKCRGELKGFQAHKEQVVEAYGEGYIAPYLLTSKKDE
jgi:hypothetical protein